MDTLNPTGYSQVMEEIVGGAVERVYSYGLDLLSQNQNIGGDWTTSFYGYDAQGSTRFLLNASGSATDLYNYDAFGLSLQEAGSTQNAYRYAGERFQSQLNLYHLRARFLDHKTGRFIQRDTARRGLDSLHPYSYGESNPINLTDPTGFQVVWPQEGVKVPPVAKGPKGGIWWHATLVLPATGVARKNEDAIEQGAVWAQTFFAKIGIYFTYEIAGVPDAYHKPSIVPIIAGEEFSLVVIPHARSNPTDRYARSAAEFVASNLKKENPIIFVNVAPFSMLAKTYPAGVVVNLANRHLEQLQTKNLGKVIVHELLTHYWGGHSHSRPNDMPGWEEGITMSILDDPKDWPEMISQSVANWIINQGGKPDPKAVLPP